MTLTESPADLVPGERWYAARTAPRKEPWALQNLQRQNYRCFMPMLLKTVRHARKTKTLKAALFPSYLFVALDVERQRWRPVNGTMGVAGLVMQGERPQPVPQGVVEQLSRATTGQGVVDFSDELADAVGGCVRVLHGPFAGLLGTLASLDDHGRARVLLTIMGAEREVAVHRGLLSPAA